MSTLKIGEAGTVQFPMVNHAVEMGLDRARLIPTIGNETFRVGNLLVHSLPSAHPTFEITAKGEYPFIGFLIEVDGLRLYHSGDTLVYPGLDARLRDFAPHIMFLPINGTDARRDALHVPPNMNAAESVALAKSVGTGMIIPHHYDMFTFNTADVNDFVKLATDAHVPFAVLQAGERFTYKRT